MNYRVKANTPLAFRRVGDRFVTVCSWCGVGLGLTRTFAFDAPFSELVAWLYREGQEHFTEIHSRTKLQSHAWPELDAKDWIELLGVDHSQRLIRLNRTRAKCPPCNCGIHNQCEGCACTVEGTACDPYTIDRGRDREKKIEELCNLEYDLNWSDRSYVMEVLRGGITHRGYDEFTDAELDAELAPFHEGEE